MHTAATATRSHVISKWDSVLILEGVGCVVRASKDGREAGCFAHAPPKQLGESGIVPAPHQRAAVALTGWSERGTHGGSLTHARSVEVWAEASLGCGHVKRTCPATCLQHGAVPYAPTLLQCAARSGPRCLAAGPGQTPCLSAPPGCDDAQKRAGLLRRQSYNPSLHGDGAALAPLERCAGPCKLPHRLDGRQALRLSAQNHGADLEGSLDWCVVTRLPWKLHCRGKAVWLRYAPVMVHRQCRRRVLVCMAAHVPWLEVTNTVHSTHRQCTRTFLGGRSVPFGLVWPTSW